MIDSVSYSLSYLDRLEAEAIHILREVAGQFEKPLLLYSVGKDSSVLLHLAKKAFAPGKLPFPLLHVDTGFKFKEMYEFRDEQARAAGATLHVFRNEAAIKDNTNPFDLGTARCCQLLKTQPLLEALSFYSCDVAIGGARRDEEKSRAKERVFSFRDQHGQWDPRRQRPELWQTYNGLRRPGESIRAFPVSDWTEIDVWLYILREKIPVVPLYFARQRKVIRRGNLLIPAEAPVAAGSHEAITEEMCRFRTLGCSPCTGAIESSASSIEMIIEEMFSITISERSTRVIDHDSQDSMERKKREGYF